LFVSSLYHAFFKALLFLSAGSLIHALRDEQDIRKMGSLVNILPFTYICFFLGSIVIMGFPFLTGFYSKDVILEAAYVRYIIDGNFIYILLLFSSFFTCFYSIRLLFFVFFNSYNGYQFSMKEDNFFMFLPLFFLCFCSVFIGFIFSDIFLGLGTFFFADSLFFLLHSFMALDVEMISPFLKNLPFIFSLLGFFIGYLISFFSLNKNEALNKKIFYLLNSFIPFLLSAYFYNNVYNKIYKSIFIYSYNVFTKTFEKGFFEYFSSLGIYNLVSFFSKMLYINFPFLFLNLA